MHLCVCDGAQKRREGFSGDEARAAGSAFDFTQFDVTPELKPVLEQILYKMKERKNCALIICLPTQHG